MSAEASVHTYTVVDVTVKCESSKAIDSQGRRELRLTEADAKSLMYRLADVLGFDVSPRG